MNAQGWRPCQHGFACGEHRWITHVNEAWPVLLCHLACAPCFNVFTVHSDSLTLRIGLN